MVLCAKMPDGANRQGEKEPMEVDAGEEYETIGDILLLVYMAMLKPDKRA